MKIGGGTDVDHDEMVATVLEAHALVTKEQVVDGFLYSLSTRSLEHRSALGSYALAANLGRHEYSPHPQLLTAPCRICGFRKTQRVGWQSWENQRQEFGGGYDMLDYIAFDLVRFSELEPIAPTQADLSILEGILSCATSLPLGSKTSELEKGMQGLFKGNKGQRQVVMGILAFCNILQPDDCPGYLTGYPHYEDRGDGSSGRADWGYPLSFWRGHDPIPDAVKTWFPMLK